MKRITDFTLSPSQATLWFLGQAGYVLPNHYDVMALNSADPADFCTRCQEQLLSAECIIPAIMQPFTWK